MESQRFGLVSVMFARNFLGKNCKDMPVVFWKVRVDLDSSSYFKGLQAIVTKDDLMCYAWRSFESIQL